MSQLRPTFVPALISFGLLSIGCMKAPTYHRPQEALPGTFAGQTASQAGDASFGDLPWFQVFQDEALQDLIRTALRENVDVRIAANRVLQTEVQLGITRANQLPEVTNGFQGSRGISSGTRAAAGPQATPSNGYAMNLSASWELDFWGKLRSQTAVAQAKLLASQESRNMVLQTLTASVAQGYFQMRELDAELEVAKKTLASREASLVLVRQRQEQGVASLSDVRQAESLVQSASHSIPLIEQELAKQENALNILVGRYQGSIPRGKALDDQRLVVNVPAGLPASLLDRRPDIRMAEQNLIAANAQIGVAKAMLFPSISLTASQGYASSDLSQLVIPGNKLWNVGASIVNPLFEGGRLKANVKLSELQKEELALQYAKTVQQAFGDVSNALTVLGKTRQARLEQESLTRTLEDSLKLATQRYEGGVAAYLEVQDAERQCFDARRGLVQAKRDELLSVLSLYKSLGGGWKTEPTSSKSNE